MGKLDLRLQILNLQGKTTRAISFRRRSNFRASGQLDLQVKTINIINLSNALNGSVCVPFGEVEFLRRDQLREKEDGEAKASRQADNKGDFTTASNTRKGDP